MSHRLPKGLLEYVKRVADGKYNQEIADLASRHFGVTITKKQISSLKTKNKITSKVPRSRKNNRLFTKEQIDFIYKNQYNLSRRELSNLMNTKFGLSTTVSQIKGYCERNGLKNRFDGRFFKGQPSHLKGTKGVAKANSGSFKVGHGKRIGSERMYSRGFSLVKVSNAPYSRMVNWRPKHEVLWEKYHKTKVPDNHLVIFLDNDNSNYSIENLSLVSRGEALKMNQYHYRSNNPEMTQLGLNIIRLDKKIKEIENL